MEDMVMYSDLRREDMLSEALVKSKKLFWGILHLAWRTYKVAVQVSLIIKPKIMMTNKEYVLSTYEKVNPCSISL